MRDYIQLIFQRLFIWSVDTASGEGAKVQYAQNQLSTWNNTSSSSSSKTPVHPAELSLKALLGPDDQQLWPPRATFHKSWPECLRGYQRVYETVSPHFAVEKASLDDAQNRQIIDDFRARFSNALSMHVQLTDVRAVLDNNAALAEPARQGFYACLSYLRHFYRWGVSPIVRVAQMETTLEIPEELEEPWWVLQRHFRLTGRGGNMIANEYYAFNDQQELEFSGCVGLSEEHRVTERWTGWLFFEIEELATPMYRSIAQTVASMEAGDVDGALALVKAASTQLSKVFRFFYSNLNETNQSRKLLVPYVQGFHGWTLNGENGASGDQALVIRTLDAFLGIRPPQTPEVESLQIPGVQRDWLNILRAFDMRGRSREMPELVAELEHMVKQLRTFRMGHIRKMKDYEIVMMPERRNMTAGTSLTGEKRAPDNVTMVQHLVKFLSKRLAETA